MIFYDRLTNELFETAFDRYFDAISDNGGSFLEVSLNLTNRVTLTGNHIAVTQMTIFGKSRIYLFSVSSLNRIKIEKSFGNVHITVEFSEADNLYGNRASRFEFGKCNRHKAHDLVRNVQTLMSKGVLGMCLIEGESYLLS